MRILYLSPLLAAGALIAATPSMAGDGKDILKGAAIGGGGGAVAGAVIPGLSVGDGALIGAAGGAVVGALDKKGHKWHRDRNGARYYNDKRGRRIYR